MNLVLNHLVMKRLNPSTDLYKGEQTNQIGQTDYVNLLNLSGLEKISLRVCIFQKYRSV